MVTTSSISVGIISIPRGKMRHGCSPRLTASIQDIQSQIDIQFSKRVWTNCALPTPRIVYRCHAQSNRYRWVQACAFALSCLTFASLSHITDGHTKASFVRPSPNVLGVTRGCPERRFQSPPSL